jgi:23S rRNA (cytidine1920-2'-O)/16S rRNA (cytidine1409-2'-O)-methyltransferase
VRLDQLLVDRALVESRNVGRGLIMAGLVMVGGHRQDKAGTLVRPDVEIEIKSRPRFVSRAGEKLAHALVAMAVDPRGASAMDVGASTGGFVDCLLQNGTERVIAVDVGYGQLDARLRSDDRVHVLERTNARHLTPADLPFVPDLLTVDVSFISLGMIMPAVVECMADRFTGLLLVKPQFEAGPRLVGKGGIVRDAQVRVDVLRRATDDLSALGLEVHGVCDSGLPGTGGNVEFFIRVDRGRGEGLAPATLDRTILEAVGVEEEME